MKHIKQVLEVGTATDGQAVTLNLETEGGATEWVSLHHSRVGRLVASVLFGSSIAATDRKTAAGVDPAGAESASLIDIIRTNASSAPGADYVCIRMVIGEGANLDFRIPLSVLPALQEKLAEAAEVARSAAPAPSA
jgi:hypothetical protein